MRSAVIGGGSWGTALASVLCQKGPVCQWARSPEVVAGINETHRNPRYQADIALPENLTATGVLAEALEDVELVCVVVPSHAMRAVMSEARPSLRPGVPIVSASKGIENESLATMEEVLTDVLPRAFWSDLAFLSGPSFARETLLRMATAVTIAARFHPVASVVQKAFSTPYFRCYTTEDVTGVELGGALKNVVAIAAGVADGLGLGHNSRAGLLTRGLAEISRLAVHRGANPLTLSGLAGMGDLVLTCTGDLSRNRTVGVQLGKGRKLAEILGGMNQVAEGVRTAKSAYNLGRREGIEMPITGEVYRVLYEDKPPAQALVDLMGRDLKRERQ
ncbi:MAG: NAD(P)-dependent glycerol-3-phosphate dehydrogenase [Myxococcales bacterium]|nr:NAD(P)-dependent glycerol-3-phosphate dehydrogenase [Myxococcales bacterium]